MKILITGAAGFINGYLIPELLAAGAYGVAVVGAVSDAADPAAAVRRLLVGGRPDLPVLSYTELSRNLTVEPVGVIHLAQRAAA